MCSNIYNHPWKEIKLLFLSGNEDASCRPEPLWVLQRNKALSSIARAAPGNAAEPLGVILTTESTWLPRPLVQVGEGEELS